MNAGKTSARMCHVDDQVIHISIKSDITNLDVTSGFDITLL